MARTAFYVLLVLCMTPSLTFGNLLPGDWSVGGSVKSLNLAFEAPPESALEGGGLSSNRFRLEMQGFLPAGLEAEIAVEHLALWRDPQGQPTLPGDLANRRIDLEHNWNENGSLSQQFQVDRLNLQGTVKDWEWRLGRQAIGFGRISLAPPLDIIAPFPPDSLDTTVRPGIDAMRLSRYFGLAGQIDLIGVAGQTGGQNSFLGTFTTNWKEIDILAIGGRLLGRSAAGAGLAGQIVGMGIKGELVVYEGKEEDLRKHFVIAGIEGDAQVTSTLNLSLQYLYNGAGAETPSGYPAAATSAMTEEGLSFLLGRHYLLAASSWQVHPLVSVNMLLITNLGDGSLLVRPLTAISLGDNLSLDLFVTLNLGDRPDNLLQPNSEFGSQGNSGGFFVRYFF